MKKVIIIIGTIIVVGFVWYLVSPLLIDKKVAEDFPVSSIDPVATNTASDVVATPITVASGRFSGFDRLHNGSGEASLIKTDNGYIIRFENDFSVTNGPDLYVGFGKNGEYVKGSEIAELKGNIGSQNYELPKGFDIAAYNEVWIWCKQFSTPFAKAQLR